MRKYMDLEGTWYLLALAAFVVSCLVFGSGCQTIPTTAEEMQRPVEQPQLPKYRTTAVVVGMVPFVAAGNPAVLWYGVATGNPVLVTNALIGFSVGVAYYFPIRGKYQVLEDKYARDLAYWELVNILGCRGSTVTWMYRETYLFAHPLDIKMEWFGGDGTLQPTWWERIQRDVLSLTEGKAILEISPSSDLNPPRLVITSRVENEEVQVVVVSEQPYFWVLTE